MAGKQDLKSDEALLLQLTKRVTWRSSEQTYTGYGNSCQLYSNRNFTTRNMPTPFLKQ